jgi:outer membrane protein assembly factor BamD (BamD/ComL family)
MQKAKVKLKLADVLVLMDSIWDASILYMQIDADFKFEPIGNEAKYKNARVFYFDGEFDYAQAQLDVLKEATSKFISNDAMQLSLLILENYGLDSNYEAMSDYAMSELLIEQHRYAEAFQRLDSIPLKFPETVLKDEIVYAKAKAKQTQGSWEEAYAYFEQVSTKFPSELLADDALYNMARINQIHQKNTESAMANYLKLLNDYPGSIYNEDVRMQIRKLRGDKVSE